MKSPLLYILEVLFCSGLLLAFYRLLLVRKVSFRACRRYLVLDRSCAPGEDAASSRPADLLLPDPGLLAAALLRTLPWLPPRSSDPAAARRFFRSVTTVIQALPWGKELAQEDGVA